ncbi:MAG: alpha/beta fold hydrolase [Planctomycetes bacterium]|nr:alpha/beta fold hydrolase [Planctomycetota bacterium]
MRQPPVVFVPGITATTLEDYYPLDPEKVWTAVLRKDYERISLHPDDLRYEGREPARVQSGAVFTLPYQDFVEALRHELRPSNAAPTPVFAFSYDWRQDCRQSAEQLASFVDEVMARTKLLPHYKRDVPNIDLVGHSMGGLIVADYLSRFGSTGKVRRVVTIGTPFQGAVDAVSKLVTGMGRLADHVPRDREREAARTFPAIYQLLPTFDGAAVTENGTPVKLLKPSAWQPSVVKSLGRYIRLQKALVDPDKLFASYLAMARGLRDRIRSLNVNDVLGRGADDWLPIAGVGSKTLVRVELRRVGRRQRSIRFHFPQPRNEWPRTDNTGDGTVPLKGACPPFLGIERVVCISPRDFSRWEFQDRSLARLAGFHAALPTVNLVQRITLRFLRNNYGGQVWAHRPPGVDRSEWRKPSWLREPN